ncbi:MAG: arginine repressor [Oscillospiraceae bacterium]|nr:arginine repressor [Oscillospiraceae bacterium]
MKELRHKAIAELIGTMPIGTQEELLAQLRQRGFDVTQATVSRDIKELRLAKVAVDGGTARYMVHSEGAKSGFTEKFKTIFRESVIKITCAGNLVVIKCYTGLGNAACEALDTMQFEQLVGTIAGDNTIFCATHSAQDAQALAGMLETIL